MLCELLNSDVYAFVIDTNTPVATFDRELAAFLTGKGAEAPLSAEFAEKYHGAVMPKHVRTWIDSKSCFFFDQHGKFTTASSWPTPGYFNDGMGNCWGDWQFGSEEVKVKYLESGGTGDPDNFPSYQSVAVFFSAMPSDEVKQMLAKRSRRFFNLDGHGFDAKSVDITGIRTIFLKLIQDTVWTGSFKSKNQAC